MHVLCGGLWVNYLGLKERPSLASVQTLLSTFLNMLKGPSHGLLLPGVDISKPERGQLQVSKFSICTSSLNKIFLYIFLAVTAKQSWVDSVYFRIFFLAPYWLAGMRDFVITRPCFQ
jgi:hypothetical protein